MNRRSFLAGLGSAVYLAAHRRAAGQEIATPSTFPADIDMDPSGGFTMRDPRKFLFTDLRHIEPADLGWRAPDGKSVPLINPPQPVIPAVADAESMPRGIRLVAQKARKEGPIRGLAGGLVLDGDVYRSWSLSADYPEGTNFGSYTRAPASCLRVTYTESTDGYDWKARQASEDIKAPAITGVDGACFFIDPHGPASERYKCLYHAHILGDTSAYWARYEKLHPRYRDDRLSAKELSGLFGMVSPDGVKWTAILEPLMIHKGDTDNCVYYDEWLGKYVLYTRLYWLRRRMIARAESDDFRHWTPVTPIVWPTMEPPYSYDVYTNARTCYPGAPEYHLMFPMHYLRYTQISEVHLYSSLDGICWNHVPGGPILTVGDPGSYDGELISCSRNLVPLGKDRVGIVFSGAGYPHKYPRWRNLPPLAGAGWASWTKDRLVALIAEEEGEFRTFLVKVAGTELRINAKVRRAGEIRVGLGSIPGRTVNDADPIFGDGTDMRVTWKGDPDVKVAQGESIIFHVKMRAAELYSIEWV